MLSLDWCGFFKNEINGGVMGSSEKMFNDAEEIFMAGVRAVGAEEAVKRTLSLEGSLLKCGVNQERVYNLEKYRRVLVIGAGKASAFMAKALEDILGDRIDEGVVIVKYDHTAPLRKVKLCEAAHPVPDTSGEKGAREIAALAGSAEKDDLVICLISGGGSALMPLPASGITLSEKQAVTDLLLGAGVPIDGINCVRKHISAIKGGRLASLVWPAELLTLMISDVIGDDMATIASGPTTPDLTTFQDALFILKTYNLLESVPVSVKDYLEMGAEGKMPESPGPEQGCFTKSENFIIASNSLAVEAAAEKAVSIGYKPVILSTTVEGEAREVARVISAVAREVKRSNRPVKPPACLLLGGETTVTLRGKGRGGRNQELALAAAITLDSIDGVTILSAGTDGTDGPTDAAGAVVDGSTVNRAVSLGLDINQYLAENNAYSFFKQCGGLINTGPTGTNVMDLIVVLIR